MMAVIAEMMIFANAAVAQRIHQAFPDSALLRRHPPPRQEAFAEVGAQDVGLGGCHVSAELDSVGGLGLRV